MSTIFLRFPDEGTFRSLLPADFEQLGESGAPLPAGTTALSIIGAVVTVGIWDENGNVITAPTPVPGFHVNALGAVPPAWSPYVITPTTPLRVFGGDS